MLSTDDRLVRLGRGTSSPESIVTAFASVDSSALTRCWRGSHAPYGRRRPERGAARREDVQAIRIEQAEPALTPSLVSKLVLDGDTASHEVFECVPCVRHLKYQEAARIGCHGWTGGGFARMSFEHEGDCAAVSVWQRKEQEEVGFEENIQSERAREELRGHAEVPHEHDGVGILESHFLTLVGALSDCVRIAPVRSLNRLLDAEYRMDELLA